jgi:hypothetical protein
MPNYIESYLQRRTIPTSIQPLFTKKNLNKKHWFYFNLVDWLSPAFPAIKGERLESLSFAFYGYFRSMLTFDQVAEERESARYISIRSMVSLVGSAVRELAYLFEEESKFWDAFYHAEKIYFHAIQYERLEWNELPSIRKADFETLAELKSASLCYPVVDAMQLLDKSSSACEELLKDLLRHLHIAFQYLDEINNFKQDCIHRQITFARKRVEESMKMQKGFCDSENPDIQYKFLFSSGVASELTGYVKEHYEQCLVITKELHLNDLENFIRQELAYLPVCMKD